MAAYLSEARHVCLRGAGTGGVRRLMSGSWRLPYEFGISIPGYTWMIIRACSTIFLSFHFFWSAFVVQVLFDMMLCYSIHAPLKKNDIWILLGKWSRRELKLSNIARILSKFSLKVRPQTDNRKQKLRKQHQTPPLQRSPDLVENCFYCPFAWS